MKPLVNTEILREKISAITDFELCEMISNSNNYTPEALDIAQIEVSKRGGMDSLIQSCQDEKVLEENVASQERYVDQRRPWSLTIFSLIIIVLFGGGYILMIGSLLTGSQSLPLSRLFVEPPEEDGGIPWPGWDDIGSMLRNEMGPFEAIPATYWWTKFKLCGSLLWGPLFIIGFIVVFMGREWGRICIYVYTASWLANKVIYLGSSPKKLVKQSS